MTRGTTLTVEALAAAKGHDPKWLKTIAGLEADPRGVLIPYWDMAGELVVEKTRTHIVAREGSLWPRGKPLMPYGLWRLKLVQANGVLFLVEGESDCWALWSHEVPALGIPGANSTGCLQAEHLADVKTLYVHREPDNGGTAFVQGVAARLKVLGWKGKAFELSIPGHKDPADLHETSQRTFRADLAEAVKASKPLGQPAQSVPAQVATEPEWEPPIPLDTLPEPAPFPMESLPPAIADYVHQAAWATNSPVDFVAVPLIGLAAGLIGGSRVLSITGDHLQPSIVFSVVVGLPGTGKSPALDKVSHPVEVAERKLRTQHRRDLAAWEEDDRESRGERPQPRRLLIDDTTTEALCRTMGSNPRGLLMVRDELSALVAGMNQYKEGKGHDRQVYLKIWAGATIRVDRKSNEDGMPTVIRRPALSIVGGVQPDVVRSFLPEEGGRAVNDGFLDRFLFAYPKDLPAIEEQFREIEPATKALWSDVANWLLSLQQRPGDDGEKMAYIVPLGEGGKDAWVEFTRGHAAELNADGFADHLRGPWSKLRGYCARLALVLELLQRAADGESGPETVGEVAIERAAKLVEYHKAHYQRVCIRMGLDPRKEGANRILAWLRRNPDVNRFSQRDLYMHLRDMRDPEVILQPIDVLTKHGYIAAVELPERSGRGRKPTPSYLVNPTWNRNSVNSVNFVTGIEMD